MVFLSVFLQGSHAGLRRKHRSDTGIGIHRSRQDVNIKLSPPSFDIVLSLLHNLYMQKDVIISLVVLLILAGSAYFVYFLNNSDRNTQGDFYQPGPDDQSTKVTTSYKAYLSDVAGGNSTGVVQAGYDNNRYILAAVFENLPELEEGYFYEGWIVRDDPESVISTGQVVEVQGKIVNTFTLEDDLTDHNKYVLTLEPDDGDPAPADHILEGEFEGTE